MSQPEELYPLYICIGGRENAGKDTYAQALSLLLTSMGIRNVIIEMSAPLKKELIGSNHEISTIVQEYGWRDAKDNFPHVRHALQDLGMRRRGTSGADYWIQCVKAEAERLYKANETLVFIITGVRFPNELEAFGADMSIWMNKEDESELTHISQTSLTYSDFRHAYQRRDSIEDMLNDVDDYYFKNQDKLAEYKQITKEDKENNGKEN